MTADDWLNLVLLAIFAPLAPFLAIEIILPSIGFKLFGALIRAPWRQIVKAMVPVAKEAYQVWTAFVWLRRIDRLFGSRRDRR